MKNWDIFPGAVIRGSLLGGAGACIGTLVFVLIVESYSVIRFGLNIDEWRFVAVAFLIGCILSGIPAMFGGGLLGWIIYWYSLRSKISNRGGFLIGALLGWMAGIISYAALLVLISFRGKPEVFFFHAVVVTIIALLIGGWVGKALAANIGSVKGFWTLK